MKFRVQLKDPDAFYEGVDKAIEASVSAISDVGEKEAVTDLCQDKMYDFASKWIDYGEYYVLEFDSDAGTCVVVPVKDWP